MNTEDILHNDKINKVLKLNIPKRITNCLDGGNVIAKPIYYLYITTAILNVIAPFYVAYLGISNGLFDTNFKQVLGAFFVWLVYLVNSIAIACLWWGRKDDVRKIDSSSLSFPATHYFSHFLQVGGESLAITFVVFGSLGSILGWLFIGNEYNAFIDVGFLGWKGVLFGLVVGFLVLLVSRFFAEQFKALATIAKNTNKLNVQQ